MQKKKSGERKLLSDADEKLARTIFRLIEGATSQELVRDFLRDRNIPVSAKNWDDLYQRRIHPALLEETVTVNELRGLLREVEESGRQHVFLYRCAPESATALLSERRVLLAVGEMELGEIMSHPLDLELPEVPTIVDVRYVAATDDLPTSLIVKQVETRKTRRFLGEKDEVGTSRVARIYEEERKRAVNMARLYADGRLELRIAAQDNSSRYHDNVLALFAAVSKLIPGDMFEAISLQKAKTKIWNDRVRLADDIRYGRSEARNDFGFSISVNTPSQEDNITKDSGSAGALESFLAEEGQVVGSNIYLKIKDSDPQREVHILLSGEVNEFAIPAACTAQDFNYVRRTIQALNT